MTNQTQNNSSDLTIVDLATMKGIIELASERNTFKPNEMAAVGIVYNKLDIFLKTVEEQQKKALESKNTTTPAGESNVEDLPNA